MTANISNAFLRSVINIYSILQTQNPPFPFSMVIQKYIWAWGSWSMIYKQFTRCSTFKRKWGMQISVNPNNLSQNQNFRLYVIGKVINSALQNIKNYIIIWLILEDMLENVFDILMITPHFFLLFLLFFLPWNLPHFRTREFSAVGHLVNSLISLVVISHQT